MEWTAWNNGSHNKTGAGYGLKVPITDRVSIKIPSGVINAEN